MARGKITERHIQAAWYDCALRPRRLFAGGEEVQVVDPGEWNAGAGPDFKNAVLELGPARRRLVGDVEIHLAPSDWSAHGHGGDAAYRSVIAHVTWRSGPVPADLPPGAISIWIGRSLVADGSFSPDAIDLGAYPFARLPSGERPCRLVDRDRATALLARAGRRRLARKAERLAGLLATTDDPEQLFYAEVMAALGYSRNAEAFRAVAAAVPLKQLVAEPHVAAQALLAASSFSEAVASGRPANSPARRLAAAAELFARARVRPLMSADCFDRDSCREIVGEFSRAAVGPGRAGAILANVVLPWAMAEGRVAAAPDWLPPEDVSRPVRLTAFRLLGRDHNPQAFYAGNGLHIQGLIDIHRSFCLAHHPFCQTCAMASTSKK